MPADEEVDMYMCKRNTVALIKLGLADGAQDRAWLKVCEVERAVLDWSVRGVIVWDRLFI
jgi:hypothetical protein